MDFPRTTKKIKYTLIGQITVNAGEDAEIESVLEAMRGVGSAEVVDVEIVEEESEDEE